MVDVTRDSLFRMQPPLTERDGPWRKKEATTTTGAGTIGLINNPDDLPPSRGPKHSYHSADGNGDAETPPPGAPELAAPKQSLAPAEMALMISVLIAKMDDAQSNAEQNGLKMDDAQRQTAFKNSNAQIAESVKKLAAAEHKKKILGPLATIAKVFAGIAAIALTIATGGLAAPLAIGLIAYTVVDTTLTIADSISRAKGGPALDLSSLLTEGFTKLAKKCGASDKEAATIGQWCAFGVQAAVAVLTITCGIKSAYSLAKGTAAAAGGIAAKLSATALKATKIAGISAQAIGGATMVSSGGLAVAVTLNQAEADKANAAKAQFDAIAAALSELIHNTLDRLQQIADDLSSGMKSASQDLSTIGQTNDAIAAGSVSMV